MDKNGIRKSNVVSTTHHAIYKKLLLSPYFKGFFIYLSLSLTEKFILIYMQLYRKRGLVPVMDL